MREILFRAKRIKDGKWAEGYLSQTTIVGEAPARLALIITEETEKVYDHYWHEIDPDTVEQFTGVSDKNGAKIFEGDIAVIDGYETGVIEWADDTASFVIRYEENDVTDFNRYWGYNLEVIGNIIDNPELLRKD